MILISTFLAGNLLFEQDFKTKHSKLSNKAKYSPFIYSSDGVGIPLFDDTFASSFYVSYGYYIKTFRGQKV